MNNIYHIHEPNPYYVQALAEHRELHNELERVRRLLAVEPASAESERAVAAAARALKELRNDLRRHFAQEESGGYLEEAIARLPRIGPQAESLQRQHRELSDWADALLADAEVGGPPIRLLRKLQADFEPFAKRLEGHERAENALLEKAFNECPDCET